MGGSETESPKSVFLQFAFSVFYFEKKKKINSVWLGLTFVQILAQLKFTYGYEVPKIVQLEIAIIPSFGVNGWFTDIKGNSCCY